MALELNGSICIQGVLIYKPSKFSHLDNEANIEKTNVIFVKLIDIFQQP